MPFNVQCKKCLHYRNEWCKQKLDSPDPDLVRDCLYYSTATNADRIRAMTDEELAKKMSGLESFALTCGGGWPTEKWLEWLRQEVEA